MQQPYYPRYQTPVPPSSCRQQLRCDQNFIGVMMIVLILSMEFVFTLLALLLFVIGVFEHRQLSMASLGLNNTYFLMFYSVAYTLSMGVGPIVVALCSKGRGIPFSPSKPCRGWGAFWGVLVGVGGCMLANVITNYILYFFSQYGVPIPEPPQLMENTPISLVLGLFVMAVLPAFLEEMVFRGYVLRTLRRYGDWYAIFVSSILFALMHGNIRQIPFALIVGIILGWLYTATDTIWLPIAVHFANNAISVVLEYLDFSLTEQQYAVTNTIVIMSLIFIGGISLLVLLIKHKELFCLRPALCQVSVAEKCRGYFSSPTQLVALVLFILLMVEEFFNA